MGDNQSRSSKHEAHETKPASLEDIRKDLKSFRQDNKCKLSEIQRNQLKAEARLEQAETRINDVETTLTL